MPHACHRFFCWHHLTLPWQCDSQKTRNATRLKCCTRHAKWRWRSPKWYACHEKCNSSSENLAKVPRLSHKTILDAFAGTWECQQVPRLPRKTAWQLVLKPSKMTGLAASLVDTATAEENQRIETRHVGASKRAFRARLPQIFTLRSFKIDMFPRVLSWTSKFATSKSMFPERFPAIFITCHKMPLLPRNLHVVTTSRSPDTAIRKKSTQDNTSELPQLPRKMTMEFSKVLCLPRKMHLIFWKRRESIAPCHAKRFSTRYETCENVTKCHACHLKRGYATIEISKSEHFCRTRHRHGHSDLIIANGCWRLRTVADGCRRLRRVAVPEAASSEHVSTPRSAK